MSLDVWLTLPGVSVEIEPRIFIREDGANKEISRAEGDSRYPGREPHTVASEESDTVYSANITHNLGMMADKAMLYNCLWCPDEHGISRAEQLIPLLTTGLALLQSDPDRFEAFNPPNKWGSYDGLVKFVAAYLAACIQYPSAEVSVSR